MALPGNFDRERYNPATGEGGRPMQTSGYTHIVDFTDIENPRKIAKYHVPEYGTHNMWIEDDILYQAYFESGVRVVDVSGELKGNLPTPRAERSRSSSPSIPGGFFPNAPFTWSAMTYKGRILFSDGPQPRGSGRLVSAVGRETGEARFDGERGSGTGRLSEIGTLSVPVLSLDDFMEDERFRPPDFIKVDVEGGEADVLRGAMKLLAQYHPTLFLATHGPEVEERCLEALRGLGYRWSALSRESKPGFAEYLAEHGDRLDAPEAEDPGLS
jgi:hypothetical protein